MMSLRLWVVEIWCVEQGAGFVQFVTIMGNSFRNVGAHGTCCMGQNSRRVVLNPPNKTGTRPTHQLTDFETNPVAEDLHTVSKSMAGLQGSELGV